MRVTKLGVVGAGTMGSGIAALAASAGMPVVLLDGLEHSYWEVDEPRLRADLAH